MGCHVDKIISREGADRHGARIFHLNLDSTFIVFMVP